MTATELLKMLEKLEITDLDDAVHEAASQHASWINNQGLGEQILYLLSNGYEPQDILDLAQALT